MTSIPTRRSAAAVASPPMPAPMIATLRDLAMLSPAIAQMGPITLPVYRTGTGPDNRVRRECIHAGMR